MQKTNAFTNELIFDMVFNFLVLCLRYTPVLLYNRFIILQRNGMFTVGSGVINIIIIFCESVEQIINRVQLDFANK